ncbi:hypothetical protein P5V15_006151 [Pogonomyrmex californicus]
MSNIIVFFIIILQANSSVQTNVVKGEILSEKKDSYTRAYCSHVPRITNGAVSRSVSCETHNSIVTPSLGLLRGVPTDPDTKLLFLAPLLVRLSVPPFPWPIAFPRSHRNERKVILVRYTRAGRARVRSARVSNWDASLSTRGTNLCESPSIPYFVTGYAESASWV